jgi:hypothetical protein
MIRQGFLLNRNRHGFFCNTRSDRVSFWDGIRQIVLLEYDQTRFSPEGSGKVSSAMVSHRVFYWNGVRQGFLMGWNETGLPLEWVRQGFQLTVSRDQIELLGWDQTRFLTE